MFFYLAASVLFLKPSLKAAGLPQIIFHQGSLVLKFIYFQEDESILLRNLPLGFSSIFVFLHAPHPVFVVLCGLTQIGTGSGRKI